MNNKLWFVILILIIGSWQIAFSATDKIDSLQNRIKSLEESREKLSQSNLDKSEALAAVNDEIYKIKNDKQSIYFWAGLLIGLFTTGITSYIAIGVFIKNKLKKLFENELHDKKNILLDIVYRKNEEITFKETKKIAIISNSDNEKQLLQSILVSTKFNGENVTYEKFPTDVKNINADIVIFNDYEGKVNLDNLYDEIKKLNNNKIGFYFGTQALNKEEYAPQKIAIANIPHQFYGNLMSALHYQNTL